MENKDHSLKDRLNKVGETLKSKGAQLTGAVAIFLALNAAVPNQADSQTLVNKKQYEIVVKNNEEMQQNIGKGIAQFLYGGGLERWIQLEINKQNSTHGETYQNDKFSLFKDPNVKGLDEKGEIKNTKEMDDHMKNDIDSMTSKDLADFYVGYQGIQKSGVNLVGAKKGSERVKKVMGQNSKGRNLSEFKLNIKFGGYFENNKGLPFTKEEQAKLEMNLRKIYETAIKNWIKKTEEDRKSMDPAKFESSMLLNLSIAQKEISDAIFKLAKDAKDKIMKQYHTTTTNAK